MNTKAKIQTIKEAVKAASREEFILCEHDGQIQQQRQKEEALHMPLHEHEEAHAPIPMAPMQQQVPMQMAPVHRQQVPAQAAPVHQRQAPVHAQQLHHVLRPASQMEQMVGRHFSILVPVFTKEQAKNVVKWPVQTPKSLTKQQKKDLKSTNPGMMAMDDIKYTERLRLKGHFSKEQSEIYEQARLGHFSKLEKLDSKLRNSLGSQFMYQNFVRPTPNQSAEDYVNNLKKTGGMEALLHPLFRMGISYCMKNGFHPPKGASIPDTFFKQLDSKLNAAVMLETISHQTTPQEKQTLEGAPGSSAEKVKQDLKRSQASQIIMAKQLLLAQMSHFSQVGEDGDKLEKNAAGLKHPWRSDVANAFGHCSRVAYELPTGAPPEEQEAMYRAIRDLNDVGVHDGLQNKDTGAESRMGSTHTVGQWSVKNGSSDFIDVVKEDKAALTNPDFIRQRGMNVAVGGYGNAGINGGQLLNDGSCGHMYSLLHKGGKGEYGSYLVGFESDAYSFAKTIKNQLGHEHTLKATSEYASSFGGQRSTEIGSKNGGRKAELMHLRPSQITADLLALEAYMRLAHQANDDTTQTLAPLVSGKMDEDQVRGYIQGLRKQIIDLHHRGY